MIARVVLIISLMLFVAGTALAKQTIKFEFYNNLPLSCPFKAKGCVALGVVKIPSFCKPDSTPVFFPNRSTKQFSCHISSDTLAGVKNSYFLFERMEGQAPIVYQQWYRCKIPPNGKTIDLTDKSYCKKI